MILKDSQIIETIKDVKRFNQGVNKFYLKFKNNKEPYVHIKPNGPINLNLDEEYYENLEENLSFMMFTWLNPIIDIIRHDFDGELIVDGDGNIETENIQLELSLQVPEKNNLMYFKRNLSKILLLEQFINKVTFKGHQKRLYTFNICLEINAKQISKILSNNDLNLSLLKNWLANIDHLNDITARNYALEGSMPVANGKIIEQLTEITLTCHHKLNGEH